MKSKITLFAIALTLVANTTATAFAAGERHAYTKVAQGEAVGADVIEAKKLSKNNGHGEEKTDTSAESFKLDFKELFGCMPMEEKVHMPPPKPASEGSKPEPMKHMQEKQI